MKSKIADLKNSEKSRYAGASKGAAFIEYFIEKGTKWIHLDIAGPSTANAAEGVYSEGATGFGTQTVLKYIHNEIYGSDCLDTKKPENVDNSASTQQPSEKEINEVIIIIIKNQTVEPTKNNEGQQEQTNSQIAC